MEEHRLRVYENRVLRRAFRLKTPKAIGRACSKHEEVKE
jgi:hypothetical protein